MLTKEQIELYESISHIKIDLNKSKLDPQGRYWTITKNGYGKFRSYNEIIDYLMNKLKTNLSDSANTKIRINQNNNVEFVKGAKSRRLCLNTTLSMNEFKKLESLAKINNTTWSKIATQIVKSYLKNN